jgi:hypothetical protein
MGTRGRGSDLPRISNPSNPGLVQSGLQAKYRVKFVTHSMWLNPDHALLIVERDGF